MKKSVCYFCGKEATPNEHAPPKALFPKAKDANGKDYRRNLIKVPSCDTHNTEKTTDDEYLMFILVAHFKNNATASNQIYTKIIRALKKTPSKAILLKHSDDIVLIDGERVGRIELDTERFEHSLVLMAHAIHFHTYNTVLSRKYDFLSAPIFEMEDDENAKVVNESRVDILELAEHLLHGLPKKGDNPEVFWYQLTPELPEGKYVLRMCFYEGFPVVLMVP